jgi:phage baseplate assembly protein W
MDVGQLFGRSIAFPPRIGPDGRWAWSAGAENIRESIEIILRTEAGERLMLNTFGGGLRRFLFEPNTTATRRLIQERIEDALRLWEPRVRVQSVRVDADTMDSQQAIVSIVYKLVATQASSRLTLTVNLGS